MDREGVRQMKTYGFPAKTYGWGWGLPATWQGWLVLGLYGVLIVVGFRLFDPRFQPVAFSIYLAGLSLVLVAICWLTGEPPAWRWGSSDQ